MYFLVLGHEKAHRAGGLCLPARCSMLLRPGEQYEQAEDDVTEPPDTKDHAGADGGADRAANLFGIVGTLHHVANRSPVGEQPERHQQVKKDKYPLEQFAEEAAFWFADLESALRALKGSITHFCCAFRAVN